MLLCVQQNILLLSSSISVVWKATWLCKLLKWTISTDVLCWWWWSPVQLSTQIKLGNYCSSWLWITHLKEIQCFTCKIFCYIWGIILWVTSSITTYQKKLCNLKHTNKTKRHVFPLHCRPTMGHILSKLHKLHKAFSLILLMDLPASWLTDRHCWGLHALQGQTAFSVSTSKLRSSA